MTKNAMYTTLVHQLGTTEKDEKGRKTHNNKTKLYRLQVGQHSAFFALHIVILAWCCGGFITWARRGNTNAASRGCVYLHGARRATFAIALWLLLSSRRGARTTRSAKYGATHAAIGLLARIGNAVKKLQKYDDRFDQRLRGDLF
jgi:hypothetical protein